MLDSQLIPIAELDYAPIVQMVIDGLDSPPARRMCLLVRDGALTRVIGVERVNGQLRLSVKTMVEA